MKNQGVQLQETRASPKKFTSQLLKRITDNFSKEREIGRGAYGVVYKGKLDDEEMAVKKLYNQPGLGDDQFNECINLMRVQHPNIVRLIGYCYETEKELSEYNGKLVFADVEERALCLEYMEGGSLERHISEEPCKLDWCRCYGIIKGISEGLKYLHAGSKHPIFHLDLKPANILLDKDNIPKIGDFGLSRLGSTHTCVTQNPKGTFGYMPPEYIDKQEITSKFDVFSSGIIFLQIMAGRTDTSQRADMPSGEFIKLVHEHWMKRMQTTVSSDASWEVKACVEIALRCVENDRAKRPTVVEIVDKLNKIGTSESTSTREIISFRSDQNSHDQCDNSENSGVTVHVPNKVMELPLSQNTGYLVMARRTDRSALRRTLIVTVVLTAVIVLVLLFSIVPEVKAISLRTLLCLLKICLWVIRLAIWLGVGVVLVAIIVLVLCFVVVPKVKAFSLLMLLMLMLAAVISCIIAIVLRFAVIPNVKAISLRKLICLLRTFMCVIRLAIWISVAMVLAAIIILVLCFVVVPEVNAVSPLMLFTLTCVFCASVWIIGRLAIWLSVAVVLAAIISLMLRLAVVPKVKADIEKARINYFEPSNNITLFSGTTIFSECHITFAISVPNPNVSTRVTNTKPLADNLVFDKQCSYNDTFTCVGQQHTPEKMKQNATGVYSKEVRL